MLRTKEGYVPKYHSSDALPASEIFLLAIGRIFRALFKKPILNNRAICITIGGGTFLFQGPNNYRRHCFVGWRGRGEFGRGGETNDGGIFSLILNSFSRDSISKLLFGYPLMKICQRPLLFLSILELNLFFFLRGGGSKKKVKVRMLWEMINAGNVNNFKFTIKIRRGCDEINFFFARWVQLGTQDSGPLAHCPIPLI